MRSRQLLLLFVSSFLFVSAHAQDAKWMLGTWNGGKTGNGKIHIARTLVIDSVSGDNFTGSRSYEADDDNQTKIVTFVSGYLNTEKLYLKDGKILYKKDPPHGKWLDCNACPSVSKIVISKDSILLSCSIAGCGKNCDGVSVYFKLLPDYDSSTQRTLVNLFGTPSDIESFKPYTKETIPVLTAERKQAIADSMQAAAELAKKRKQEIEDSSRTAAAIAKQRQQQIDDSLRNMALIEKKKRQQQVDDSLKNVALIAKRQQQVADSLKTVAAIAKQRQQQVDDSLRNVALIEKKKRQQQVDDSLKNVALIAKRQQQIADSLKTVAAIAKKRQQQIDDSLRNVALIEKKKRDQQVSDSLKYAAFLLKKRQQEVSDSIKNAATVAKQRQQKIQDSLKTAAIIAKKRQQQVDDSLRNVANLEKIKRQKQIDDSLTNVAVIAKKRQQEIEDSIKNAASIAAKKPAIKDSGKNIAVDKVLEQRDNVLVQSFNIKTRDILIELFDNAEIDGDMVSVYHNNELIVSKKRLAREPITFKVHADSIDRTHEFILVAENLGTIPPNTALMRITAGKQIYQLTVKTDLQKNARIVLYYDGN